MDIIEAESMEEAAKMNFNKYKEGIGFVGECRVVLFEETKKGIARQVIETNEFGMALFDAFIIVEMKDNRFCIICEE